MKIQGESQVVGLPVADTDGRRLGRNAAVDYTPQDPHAAAWFVVRLHGWRRGLRAVPAERSGLSFGRVVGPPLFDRPQRPRLRDGRDRAEQFLARYGHGTAIVLARFVPVVPDEPGPR